MSVAWLQRGSDDFAKVEAFISRKIFGTAQAMLGDTAMVSMNAAGDALGAALFQNFYRSFGTIEISAAAVSPRWLSRSVLFEMFTYPFDQLGCQAVILRCDPENAVMQRIATAYGFERYEIPRLRGRDKAETIHVLADDVWRKNGYHKEHVNG